VARAGREPRRGRAPFELLRFSAQPVPGGLVVVELEGRFPPGRFTRQPVLVVEAGAERPRLELAPVRAALEDGRWRAAYAIPAESYAFARFALGHRGTLLDLPSPDEPPDGDRLTALAREVNALRRRLEAAEADAATARAEAAATSAELGAAVSAARDEALAESAERVTALEHEVAEAAADAAAVRAAHATTNADQARRHEQALADATARADAADERARIAVAAAEAGADERARAAIAVAEARALAAEEGIAVLRAELAEERERSQATIDELEQERERLLATEADARERQRDDDPDKTQVLAAIEPDDDEDDDTRPFTVVEEHDVDRAPVARAAIPPEPRRSSPPARRSSGAWIAVAALALFVFVLLGLLLGFLP
jgi:hypothetical protein